MASISKPKTWAALEVPVYTDLNSDFDTIYNDYNGNITDFNVSPTAAIQSTKILNQAVTALGAAEQAVTQPTKFKLPRFNFDSNAEADFTIVGAAQNINLADNTKRLKAVKAVAAASLSTITPPGGSGEGLEIVLCLQPTTGTFAGAVTVNHTATDTLNSIHLKGLANVAGGVATGNPRWVRLVYTKCNGYFTNFQWVEL